MTQHRAPVLLWDAHRAATRILQFVAGRTEADYDADDLLRSAVERQFAIIGEPLSRLRRVNPELAARIHSVSAAIAFRNHLIHGYDVVNNVTVWTTISDDLPKLTEPVAALLKEFPTPSKPKD